MEHGLALLLMEANGGFGSVAAPSGAGPHAFWDQSSTCSEMLSASSTSIPR
jgi:hypothetical protein